MRGPLLIALAAFLWATDAIFRYPAISSLSAPAIVWIEHSVCLLLMIPLVFWLKVPLKLHRARDWAFAFLIGAGGSAVATLCFTESFRYLNPSAAILLQKLQPIAVILLAGIFLGERPAPTFYPWAAIALISALGVSTGFQNGFFGGAPGNIQGMLLAATAALLWGLATVAGKSLLSSLKPVSVTFWRYFFGFLAAGFIVLISPATSFRGLADTHLLFSLVYIALGPGLLALLCYYRGLKETSASVATIVELVFPLSAVLLNWVILGTPLTPAQLGWGAVLLLAITRIQVSRRW